MEIRLQHDVAGVGVDDLPMTVGADTGGAGKGTVAAGVQIDLQVGFVTVDDGRAQLAEVVRSTVGGGAIREGELQLSAFAEAGKPAAPGHMGIVAETPGIVAVALGDEILGGLGAVLVVRPAVSIGDAFVRADGRDFRGVEVVPLEVQAEGGIGGNRNIQRNAGIDGQVLGARTVAGTVGLVDGLGEDVALDIRIGIQVVQAGVAGGVQHSGIGVIVGAVSGIRIRIAHGGVALHDGAGDAHMILVSGEVGVIGLLAADIVGVALQVNVVAAASAAVHVLVGGQVQGHAAQRLAVSGKGTVGIASGRQLGVEHLVVADQLAAGHIIRLLALVGGGGEVAVQEHVLDLVAQHLIAVGVLGNVIQLDDGIAAGVVLAHEEAELHGGVVLHGQGQRPGVGGEVHAVVGGIEAIDIRTGLRLR